MWTPRIGESAVQPAQAILEQGNRVQARFTPVSTARIFPMEQLNKRGGYLFSGAARGLVFHGVPIAVTDRQALQQLLSQYVCPGGPPHARR